MNQPGTARLKILAVLLFVFALGCVTGASLDGIYRLHGGGRPDAHGGHDEEADRKFEEMRRDLNLTDAQAAQVRTILDETRDEFHQLRAEARPRYEALRVKARERIKSVLTPEQQQRFDAIVAEHDSRRREREEK